MTDPVAAVTDLEEATYDLIKALERYAKKSPPGNFMGGCYDCGQEVKGRHTSRCKWKQARTAIDEARHALGDE